MGSEDNKGIIPRLNDELFRAVRDKLESFKGDGDTKFMITVSYLEIYNEVIKDLLNPSDKKKLEIRQSPTEGIYVEGLCELIVRDAADVIRLIEQGNTVRRVAATNMNEQSSRSHSCFTIALAQKTTTELAGGITREQVVRAKINLVDLAGSERVEKTGATGATLKEGSAINMSLQVLGRVINALAEGRKGGHVPYRDSKLTRLLQESLGGNSSTIMIAAVSPADYNYDETVSTLRYANRAKSIANAVKRNEDVNERMIRELKEEIEKLKQKLLSEGQGVVADPAVSEEQRRRLQELEESQRSAWEEKERLTEVHRVRQKLRELEEQTTTERAELVTTAGILDEDNKLRQRIQEEERDKARAAIQAELSEARAKLEKERDEARGTIEADFKQQLTEARAQALEYRTQAIEFKGKYKQSEMERLRLEQQISELAQKNGELEDRLVEAEEAIAVTQQEAEALATDKANVQRSLEDALEAAKVKEVEYHRRLEANQRQHSAQLEAMVTDSRKSAEDREFQVFRALMDTFQVERKELADKLESMRRLLSQATQDMVYLSLENNDLRERLAAAVVWEPAIHPTRSRAPTAATTVTNGHFSLNGNASSSGSEGGPSPTTDGSGTPKVKYRSGAASPYRNGLAPKR
eukprot:gene1966-2328_t